MKYTATITRKYQQSPIETKVIEIPDDLSDENRVVFAAHELLKLYDVHIDPIKEESCIQ